MSQSLITENKTVKFVNLKHQVIFTNIEDSTVKEVSEILPQQVGQWSDSANEGCLVFVVTWVHLVLPEKVQTTW